MSETSSSHDQKKRRKILVVDDEPKFVDVVKKILEAHHYDVVTAGDGDEGLRSAHTEKPDLILLDIMMPTMDGYEMLRLLKNSQETQRIPVVMLSAKGERSALFKSQELHAEDHVAKPFDIEELLRVIQKHMWT